MKCAKPFQIDKKLILAAFRRVKTNRGAAGVDAQSIKDFEHRLNDNLYLLWNRMSSGSYFPSPVRAVEIAKQDGGLRTLGIPTVSDRVAQTAVKMLLEPGLDAMFDENSYGFRLGRSAHQALLVTRKRCWRYAWVVEFDIRKLFDRISHHRLMKALRHHENRPWILLYVERWLAAPLQKGQEVGETRTEGIPQGGPLCPLLANLFMHYGFDAWMRREFSHLPFCRYADDGLVHCRTHAEAQKVLSALDERMQEIGLGLHPDKTGIVYCKDQRRQKQFRVIGFDFLGYTFRPRRSFAAGQSFLGFGPAVSLSASIAMRRQAKSWHLRSACHLSLLQVAQRYSSIIRGWINYYCLFNKSHFFRLSAYLNAILIKWGMSKFKHLRGRKGKAMLWLNRVMRRRPSLFPHWQLGHAWSAA